MSPVRPRALEAAFNAPTSSSLEAEAAGVVKDPAEGAEQEVSVTWSECGGGISLSLAA